MTDMREIYLTPFLDMKIGLNTSRNCPKLRKNSMNLKCDDAEGKGIKKGVEKKMRARVKSARARARAPFSINFALN